MYSMFQYSRVMGQEAGSRWLTSPATVTIAYNRAVMSESLGEGLNHATLASTAKLRYFKSTYDCLFNIDGIGLGVLLGNGFA
jgi:hypothetical protein